jgi:putative PIN family toxin of toxin-antitoxin system
LKDPVNVLLDTNVLVSALLSDSSPPAEIVRRWEEGAFDVIVSPALLSELERALAYPQVAKYLRLTPDKVDSFIRGYAASASLVEPQIYLYIIESDPGDNKVLECAAAGSADYIVSGDRHLLDMKEYRGIVILPPASFLVLLDVG